MHTFLFIMGLVTLGQWADELSTPLELPTFIIYLAFLGAILTLSVILAKVFPADKN